MNIGKLTDLECSCNKLSEGDKISNFPVFRASRNLYFASYISTIYELKHQALSACLTCVLALEYYNKIMMFVKCMLTRFISVTALALVMCDLLDALI